MKTKLIKGAADLAAIKTVAQKAFSNTSDAKLEEWFSFPEMDKAIQAGRGVCLEVLSDNEAVQGFIYAQQESIINGKEGLEKWVIVIAAVDPVFAGKGAGSLLLKEIEEQAANKGARKIFVYTNKDDDKVINFYKKNGYGDAGWVKDYQYGKGNSAVFLIKHLA